MRQTLRRSAIVWVITILFAIGLLFHSGRLAFNSSKWATYPFNPHLFDDGQLINAGIVYDRDGVVLAQTQDGKRVYNDSAEIREATVFAVGDLEGFVSTGAHSAFLKYLTGYDFLNGVYGDGEGNNIVLTIDTNLSVTALNALSPYSGAVGVMNYKTGEIICMASNPAFDPADPPSNESGTKSGVYVNRLINGQYAPGSIFKVVTTLSALQNLSDVYSREYECHAGVTIEGEVLSCLGNHGSMDIRSGLIESCNATFAQIALDVGRDNLTATAQSVGFDKDIEIDGVKCARSYFDVKDSRTIDFGWAGIGQYSDLVNPAQYLGFMASIANDGVLVKPHYLMRVESQSGSTVKSGASGTERYLSEDHAQQLQEMMRADVINHYGDFSSHLSVCAKTGTAEIGTSGAPHSWFVGFCQNEEYPYAFVVVAENAGEGVGVARSIAASVLSACPAAN